MQETTRSPSEHFDVESLLDRALEHQTRGEWGAAEGICLSVLRAQPRNARALLNLGVLGTQTGRSRHALDLIAASIAVDPHQAAAYSTLGSALMALGRHVEAVPSAGASRRASTASRTSRP